MIDRIRRLFSAARESGPDTSAFADRHVAAAALLVEAAGMDGAFCEDEAAAVRAVLERHFDFSPEEIESLMEEGRKSAADSNQIVAFTRALKDACDYGERVAMIEMLWEVVLADGELHDYEANLLRRIGGLLYVSDRDRGDAGKRVRARLGTGRRGT